MGWRHKNKNQKKTEENKVKPKAAVSLLGIYFWATQTESNRNETKSLTRSGQEVSMERHKKIKEKWEECGKVVTGAANKCPICAVTGTLEARF